ncbi:MAG: hypothetical protein JWQ66_4194 [Mucilaginibacter sp.]|nr:hypothetical protein [Mucilaginibacter sp.]
MSPTKCLDICVVRSTKPGCENIGALLFNRTSPLAERDEILFFLLLEIRVYILHLPTKIGFKSSKFPLAVNNQVRKAMPIKICNSFFGFCGSIKNGFHILNLP